MALDGLRCRRVGMELAVKRSTVRSRSAPPLYAERAHREAHADAHLQDRTGDGAGARRPLTSRGTRTQCAPSRKFRRKFRLEPNSVRSIYLRCCRAAVPPALRPAEVDMHRASLASLHGLC